MSYRQFKLSYTDWKTLQTALTANVYYETVQSRYKSIVIDIIRENVYFTEIDRIVPNTNLTDFETNIKSGATSVSDVADAVAIEIPLTPAANGAITSLPAPNGGTETLVRISFGSVLVAYDAGAQLVTTAARNHLMVRNDTDGDILLSLDGSTNHFKILANEVAAFDGVTIADASTVRIKRDGGAPTSGEVTLSAWSDR